MSRTQILNIGAAIAAVLFIGCVALFKVVDSDIWWHIRAGQVMWETKSLITLDPFAYTRAGLPYLATHEWVSQLVLALAYGIGSDAGIIVLRILCALGVATLVLSIDRKNLWPNALLMMGAAIVMRQGFIERPQMFSNILFAANILIGLLLLNTDDLRRRKRFLITMVGLQILWVNMHGAEALLSFLILGAVFFQEIVGSRRRDVLRLYVLAGLALFAAMFISPNTYHNFSYVWLLFTDRTAEFIKEWSPHPWNQYLIQFGVFWIVAIASIVTSRRHIIATSIILLVTGVLSRMGARHEVLFMIAALAITFYELQGNEKWQTLLEWLRARLWAAILLTIVLIGMIVWIDASYRAFVWRSNLKGIGHFAPAEGAVDFLERNKIVGNVFNSYAIGNYLMFRKIPVFLDGRNVDYGYEYLKQALDARGSAAALRDLEQQYKFTIAVLESGWTNKGSDEFMFLKDDPTWVLVYVDDWTAVYLKNIPDHRAVIDAFPYKLLTPQGLRRESLMAEVPQDQWPALQTELLRAIKEDTHGIDALVRMGQLAATAGQFDPAIVALDEAMRRAPGRYEPFALAAAVHAAKQEWAEAGALYEAAIARTTYLPIELNYEKVADVFEQAGDVGKAEKYRKKANVAR